MAQSVIIASALIVVFCAEPLCTTVQNTAQRNIVQLLAPVVVAQNGLTAVCLLLSAPRPLLHSSSIFEQYYLPELRRRSRLMIAQPDLDLATHTSYYSDLVRSTLNRQIYR